jgi:polyhydroxyalkanoate synthesis repressor PhaR
VGRRVGEGAIERCDRRASSAGNDDVGSHREISFQSGLADGRPASFSAMLSILWTGRSSATKEQEICSGLFVASAASKIATKLFPERDKPLIVLLEADATRMPGRKQVKSTMANEQQPITIKKYANRRLYNTGTSTYVTLEDLASMVKRGEDFVVYDAKTGEDITRSVLGQIIFEQEGKNGQGLLPITFLRQLIRFYGDSMQMLVPSYLEFSIDRLTGEQQNFKNQLAGAFGGNGLPGSQIFGALEEQARKNMALFNQALTMFNPFAAASHSAAAPEPAAPGESKRDNSDLDAMKKQLEEMQKQIDSLSRKD